jgi:hypothetical protein
MPAPDPVAVPTGIAPGHALLYTLTLPDGRKVNVYGNPETWRQSAAKLLLDAMRYTQTAPTTPVAITQK